MRRVQREHALADVADTAIVADVGPEVISGSTRMKASSAQKMILNMITTGAMTRLGYVYENLMVNVHMKNAKLVERGIRVLMYVCGIDRETAIRTIKSARKVDPDCSGDAESECGQDGGSAATVEVRWECPVGHRRFAARTLADEWTI